MVLTKYNTYYSFYIITIREIFVYTIHSLLRSVCRTQIQCSFLCSVIEIDCQTQTVILREYKKKQTQIVDFFLPLYGLKISHYERISLLVR